MKKFGFLALALTLSIYGLGCGKTEEKKTDATTPAADATAPAAEGETTPAADSTAPAAEGEHAAGDGHTEAEHAAGGTEEAKP